MDHINYIQCYICNPLIPKDEQTLIPNTYFVSATFPFTPKVCNQAFVIWNYRLMAYQSPHTTKFEVPQLESEFFHTLSDNRNNLID